MTVVSTYLGSNAQSILKHLLDTDYLETVSRDAVDEILAVDNDRVDGGGGRSQATHGGEEFGVRLRVVSIFSTRIESGKPVRTETIVIYRILGMKCAAKVEW